MPTPVAFLLKSPEMTFSFARNGSMGSSDLLSSMSLPAPLADQCLGLIPLPMKRAANRCGKAWFTASPAAAQYPHRQRFEPGEGHRHARPAEHGSPIDLYTLGSHRWVPGFDCAPA